jgi:hypothetical protein
MGAKENIERLLAGESFISKEPGNSMVPKIYHRQPVLLQPVDTSKLEVGDMVYVKVHGRVFTHLIWSIKGDQVQIGNNKGHSNGWTSKDKVYGIVTEVDGVEVSGAKEKVKKV